MKRLLASLSLIALALGIVAIGGVYAPFTDTGADSGDVAAGDISIRLNTDKGMNEVWWDIPPCVSDNMKPGDVCSYGFTVHNDGSVWLTYTVGAIETDCFDVAFTGPFDTSSAGDPVGDAGKLPPNDVEPETISATVTLVDDDDCQGASASVGISVSATSIPTP